MRQCGHSGVLEQTEMGSVSVGRVLLGVSTALDSHTTTRAVVSH